MSRPNVTVRPDATTTAPAASTSERGSALVIALLLLSLLLMLGTALLTMAQTEEIIAANDVWSEGAFYAAEAAVWQTIDGIDATPASLETAVEPTSLDGTYTYRSGGRADAEPRPPEYVGTVQRAGFALGDATGYNSSSYGFAVYRINGTGTGPRGAVREVEVEIEYGPLAR